MKTPTLEEVKEYFKDAKEVRCLYTSKVYDITSAEIIESPYFNVNKDRFEAYFKEEFDYCRLYKNGKYAEIITYKTKQMKTEFTITKEQILKISYESPLIKEKLNIMFPEAFEPSSKELND